MSAPTAEPSTVRAVAAAGLLAVTGGLAGIALTGIAAGRAPVVVGFAVAALAAVAAFLVSQLAPGRRWVAGVVGAGAVVVGVAAIWPDESGRTLPTAVVDALARGWAHVVTVPIPAAPGPRVLVPLAVVVWAATFAAVLVALRTAGRMVPLLPVAVAFGLACVAAGRAQTAPLATGVVFVASAGALLALRAPRPSTTARRGHRPRAVTAAVPLVVVGAVAALAGPVLAFGRDDDPFDPRDHIDPPQLPAEAESPLDLVAGNLRNPDTELFTVRFADDSGAPVPIRLVALDAFDGATWTVSGAWETAGRRIRTPARPAATIRDVAADIVIPADGGLRGAFLPTLGDTAGVRGVEAIVEPSSGALAVTGDADVAGLTYEVDAAYASIEGLPERRLVALEAATDDEAAAATRLPDDPPSLLIDVAETAAAGQTAPMLQAISLARYLSDGGYRLADGDDGRGGHTYYHLLRTLTETHTGTSEQYAAAFAVLGRILGLPTRLVVGFEPDADATGTTIAVRGGDVVVWPEVKFDGAGWLAFDPTPDEAAADVPDDVVSVGGAAVQISPPQPESRAPRDEPAATGSDDSGGSTIGRVLVIAAVAAAALALAALVSAAVIVAAKRRRTRRRRRAADTRHRVLGAWHDVLDRLAEAGSVPPGARTVEEHIGAAPGDAALLAPMARPVGRALYGATGPDDHDAETAWTCRDRFVRALRRSEPAGRRVRLAVSPRPLLTDRSRYRRRRAGGGVT